MEESKVKTPELYPASENEKQSLIEWYKDHSNVELHDDGINTLVKICPPEEYGEDEDCEGLQDIIRVMYYRLSKLEARNKELEALVKELIPIAKDGYRLHIKNACHQDFLEEDEKLLSKAEQALNKKEI